MDESNDADADWSVGRWRLSPAEGIAVGWDLERSLSADHYREFRDAAGLLRQLAGGRMMAELEQAFRALIKDADAITAGERIAETNRREIERHLSDFLAELTRFRARLEAFADDYTPGQPALDLRAATKHGYQVERHFRLAWELRNDVEHGGAATRYVRWSSVLEDGAPVYKWLVDVRAAIAGHANDRRWAGVSKLWDGIDDECHVLTLVSMAYSFLEVTFASYVLLNRKRIEDARAVLQRLVDEVNEEGAVPVVAKLDLEGEAGAYSIAGLKIETIDEQDIEFTGHIIVECERIRERWDALRQRQ